MVEKRRLMALRTDLRHVCEVLAKVPNPYHRYQLTFLLETAAKPFMTGNEGHHTENSGRDSCKRKQQV
jgi:hypothetical protein